MGTAVAEPKTGPLGCGEAHGRGRLEESHRVGLTALEQRFGWSSGVLAHGERMLSLPANLSAVPEKRKNSPANLPAGKVLLLMA